MKPNKKIILYASVFILAFLIRVYLIYLSENKNEDIDLQIYRNAGELIVNSVNPYNPIDNIELRDSLRRDSICYNEWVCSDQGKWDYYASSNLPLATLFFGGVEYVFKSALAYRLLFAFFDSILSILILAFVFNKWQLRTPQISGNKFVKIFQDNFVTLLAIFLGAFSPLIWLWGTWIPEHKTMGLLLILSSIYLADSPRKRYSLFLSPVLLGMSVAFIGLGVFIAPVCLYYIYKISKFKGMIIYSVVAFLSCIASLIPFMPELLTMMSNRLSSNSYPIHGSMWAIFYEKFPENWLIIKNIFIGLFITINLIGFFRKRLNIIVLSASLIYLFTCIYMINGSMDRMNIALFTVIILLGCLKYHKATIFLSISYIIYGAFAFAYTLHVRSRQDFDGYFVLFFSAAYFVFLTIQTFSQQKAKNEIKYSNSGV